MPPKRVMSRAAFQGNLGLGARCSLFVGIGSLLMLIFAGGVAVTMTVIAFPSCRTIFLFLFYRGVRNSSGSFVLLAETFSG